MAYVGNKKVNILKQFHIWKNKIIEILPYML